MPDTPPDEPKKSLFEKLGAGLPIGLTALATILAGLSTGELSRAMYWRSMAAQDQGKANDQWSLAGFKRDRALICEATADTLKAVGGYRVHEPWERTPTPEVVKQVREWMRGKGEPPVDDPAVKEVLKELKAVHDGKEETEVPRLARKVDPDTLERQIAAAMKQSAEVETAFDSEVDRAKQMANPVAPEEKAERTARKYEVDSHRYRAEATANQWVGFLYEVRVKTSAAESDRHRQRSENFFFAMLAAQIGGVGSSLALARKRRSVLWLVAGVAGLVAIGFGAFVYLTM
jgi:hypothetical protein